MNLDTTPRLVKMLDGEWGVSTFTPTFFPDGRRVPGNWDVRIRKATNDEITSMTSRIVLPDGEEFEV